MPQKNIFTKYPLLSVPHSFLSCGLIRSEDQHVIKLYEKMQAMLESPSVWEGAFRLAALIVNDPVAEPVTEKILASLADSDNGSFSGRIEEQIAIARAAMALFEYNTDRLILKRIAAWCRYLEIEWDQLFLTGRTIFCPADLMELLVRFYQASGIRSVLRLCTKLRSAAFDWTTSLHTIRQVISRDSADAEQISFVDNIKADELDYDQKQALLNHAVMLADGIRYSLFAGIFSGNRQDLSAGKIAWESIQKRYRAICGGTTSDPFLIGAASNAPVSTEALAAWTEAFSAQMLLADSEWAIDELIRIIFNGLSYCLKENILPEYQYVNNITYPADRNENHKLFARLSRAVATAFSHGVTVTETGLKVNYLLETRYIMMIRKQPVLLNSDGQKMSFSLKAEMSIPVSVFKAGTESAAIYVLNGEKRHELSSESGEKKNGHYLHIEKAWHTQDLICFNQEEKIISESTHHQGVCWFVRNRLLAFPCGEKDFGMGAAETPLIENNRIYARLYQINSWHMHKNKPADIPVLPDCCTVPESVELIPYDSTTNKISMFPKVNPLCLK